MSPELPAFRLLIKSDEGDSREEPLESDEISIGRTDENTIQLDERNVSRAHAVLRKENGSYRVEDLDSYNGIKINGKKMKEPKVLEPGDRLLIGDFTMAFLSGDAVSEEMTAQVRDPDAAATSASSANAKDLPPRLIVLAGPRVGSELPLPEGRSIIGRGEEAAVWVNDTSMSREHAAIDGRGDTFEIRDLGSSNGVLVNGVTQRKGELVAGDVIELGNVRLKFVPRGVASSVPERPVAMTSQERSRSPAALFIPFVFVGVAAAVAFFYWQKQGETGQTPDAIAQFESSNLEVPPTRTIEQQRDAREKQQEEKRSALIDELAEACESAMVSGSFEQAMASADEALELSPTDERARSCRKDAYAQLQLHQLRGLNEAKAWQEAQALIIAAQRQLSSSALQSDEVKTADRGFAKMKLAEARRLRYRRHDDALAIAEDLLTHPRLDEDLRSQAERLRDQLDRPMIAATNNSAPTPQKVAAVRSQPTRSLENDGGNQGAAAASANPLERCKGQPDHNRCIVDEVSRPRNKAQCVSLIKAHQNLHNGTRAVEVAKTCVERSLCDHPLCLALASR